MATVAPKPKRTLGLLAAVVVAWALLVPLPFAAQMANDLWWPLAYMRGAPVIWPSFGVVFVSVIFMAIFGLPLAMIFCFGGGYPAWLLASRFGLKRRRAAAFVGAILGLVLDLVLALLKLVALVAMPGGDEPLSKLLVFYPGIALYVALVGAAAGLAALWASGAGHRKQHDELAHLFA